MPTSLINQLQKSLTLSHEIELDGQSELTLSEIVAVARQNAIVHLNPTPEAKSRLETIHHHMLNQVRDGVPIYGATTAYGAQADKFFTSGDSHQRIEEAKALSDAIIHVDVSTGPLLPDDVVRAAMLLRVNMLLPGYSAVRKESLQLLIDVLNLQLTPLVGSYGTVGASGDLALNGRVLSMLTHQPTTLVKTKDGLTKPSNEALPEAGLSKLSLDPKEGLGFVNGDNFSTAAAALLLYDICVLAVLNLGVSALSIQALKGSTRNFHPLLSHIRPHPGQSLVSSLLLNLLSESQLSPQELDGHKPKTEGNSVQDPYSIRCLPQFYGPDFETLTHAWETITINANSVSDNPLWTTPETITPNEAPYQWVSGGNFLAMHMAETLDSIRKVVVHVVKQNDRHLNRLVNTNLNNGLPPNLSSKEALSQCTFKGLQTQMGMYDVYATILAAPVSTAFGIHEELNQDITSHAMTSYILTQEVLKLAKYAVATNFIASCQAIDFRGGPDLLSPATKPLYHWLRDQVPFIDHEQPLGHYLEKIGSNLLTDTQLIKSFINSLTNH